MSQEGTLSLRSAILINLNIMLGAGIFTNTIKLSQWAGALGCLMYPLIGLLMLPLIISVAKLVQVYPEAGFYGYGANAIHPFVGFLSSWVYFTGKLASAMFMIHVALSLVHQIIPVLNTVPILLLDCLVLIIFLGLNMLNVKTGSTIQVWFMALKIIPIFFSILAGLYLFSWHNYSWAHVHWEGIPSSLPLVLYAASGFEAACSLSCKIKNARRNGPLAIFISYGIMVSIAFLYQLIFYGALGPLLAQLSHYTALFPAFLKVLAPNYMAIMATVQVILYLAIAASALGSGYGILFSNPWNLYAMARHDHIVFKALFTKLNTYGTPIWCLVAEGCLCLLYLFVTQGDQLSLIQTSGLACSLAYTLSVISLIVLVFFKRTVTISRLIPILALCSCTILIGSCIRNFFLYGIQPFFVFALLILFGIGMFIFTGTHKNRTYQH